MKSVMDLLIDKGFIDRKDDTEEFDEYSLFHVMECSEVVYRKPLGQYSSISATKNLNQGQCGIIFEYILCFPNNNVSV